MKISLARTPILSMNYDNNEDTPQSKFTVLGYRENGRNSSVFFWV